MRGVPTLGGRGYPPRPGPEGGEPTLAGGTYLGQVQMGGGTYPGWGGGGYLPWPGPDRGIPTLAGGTYLGQVQTGGTYLGPGEGGYPKVGTPVQGLATRQAVCLLRSRRRTFLFLLYTC